MSIKRTHGLFSLLLIVTSVALFACGSGDESEPQGESGQNADFLYQDDFSEGNTGEWLTEGDELGSTEVNNDQLVIDVVAPNTLQYSTLKEPAFDDFDLAVSGILLEGSEDSTFGILLRMQSPSEFYRFEIMAGGQYMIERLNNDGTWTRFFDDWQNSEAIQVGVNGSNRLRVVADGPVMTFYVNGELLQEIEDTAYASGKIGLDAGTFGHPKTRVAFDDLRISPP